MRMITIMLICTALSACGTGNTRQMPEQTIVIEERVYVMTRDESIEAIKDCEQSGLRAIPIWGKRMINGMPSRMMLDVTCAPRWTRWDVKL